MCCERCDVRWRRRSWGSGSGRLRPPGIRPRCSLWRSRSPCCASARPSSPPPPPEVRSARLHFDRCPVPAPAPVNGLRDYQRCMKTLPFSRRLRTSHHLQFKYIGRSDISLCMTLDFLSGQIHTIGSDGYAKLKRFHDRD